MEHSCCDASQFYVVHFIEKPFKGIDYYVCVPYTWVLHRFEENKNLLVVAYPKNENPSVTRERVQKKDKYRGGISGWQFCKAKLKCLSDTYKDAERWISKKKNLRSLVQENSEKKPWDHELRYGYQKYFSESKHKSERVVTPNRVPRKQLPNAKDMESLDKEKKKYFSEQLERNETVKSTVQNTSTEPVSSITDQSITIGDKQPIENAATNNAPNTEDSTRPNKQNNHINSEQVLIIDVDEYSEVNIEDHSQQSETRNQNELAAPKSPFSIEQTPQNQHYYRRLRKKDIQNLTALSNNQELRVYNVSNERPFTFQHNMSSSLSNSAELWNQNQNRGNNMPSRPQNILIPVDLTKQLPKPLNKDLRVNYISNERPPTLQHNMSSSATNSAEFWNQNQNSTKNMPIRPQNVLIPVDLTKQLTKPLNQDLRVNNISNERPPTFQHNMSSSASNSAEFWNQNQNSRRNMSIRPKNDSIPVDLTKRLPKPLTKLLTANIQKARQETSLLITNINSTRVESMGFSSQDIQHVAAMIPVPATPRGVASVTSPKSLLVNHEQFSFIPQIVQQNLPYPQEHKQTREQDLAQRLPVLCEHRFAPRRLESHPSEVTQHQPFRQSFNNVPTNVPSQFYQPLDIQHQVQRVVTHQNAQQRPASILRKNNRRNPNLQGVKKIIPPPALPRAPKSITQVLVNSLKNYRWNEPELQEILNESSSGVINALPSISSSVQTNCSPHNPEPMGSSYKSSSEPPPVYENFDQKLRLQTQVSQSDGTNSTKKRVRFQDEVEKATKQTIEESECPINLDMEEPLSLAYGTASGSGVDTDHEAVSGSEMLVDEALEATNEIDQTEDNSVDRSQDSLSKLASQLQTVENFSTVCMTLHSSLKNATNMLDNLRDSFLKIAKSRQTSSDNNQRFDTPENLAYHAPSSSNVRQEIPPVVKRRQISAPERRNYSNRSLQKGDDVNKASARIHKKNSRKYLRSRRWFVLPSEYDPNNTKWTLKYQEGMSGVVELMPKSKIYVKLKELKRLERVSTSCELLAQLMLHEVFNEKALGVCATMMETARGRYKSSPDARPPLDNHGSLVLLNYVIQYAIDSDWNFYLRNILKTLDNEIREIRLDGLKSRSK